MPRPDLSQKKVNEMLRERFGEVVTFENLQSFYEETDFYPFWIRKDKDYRLARGKYRVPKPDEPLSKFGPGESDPNAVFPPAPGAVVVHKNDVTDDALLVPEVVAADEDDAVVVPKRKRNTGLSRAAQQSGDDLTERKPTMPRAGAFRHSDDLSAGDITRRLEAIALGASMLASVPEKLKEFVPFGDFELFRRLIAAKKFYPMFTTGLSGCGKTLFPEQACALEGREFIALDITEETDESDLIGAFALRGGETYFELGPVPVAMIRGAVLLLNEIDLGRNKILCMQSVVDGKPLTIKKLGVTITAAPGFQIFATANTKGRGDLSGKFIGTGHLNEAFLERFPATIEQTFPSAEIEAKILSKTFEAAGGTVDATSREFFDTLVKWAASIRATHNVEGVTDIISTRRLCHIVRGFQIFGDQETAMSLCTNRFDASVKDGFIDLYNKLAPDTAAPTNVGSRP